MFGGAANAWASLVAQLVKNLPAMQETQIRFLGWEGPLDEGMATHANILTWRIPMDRGAWRANSPRGYRESDTTERPSTVQHNAVPRGKSVDLNAYIIRKRKGRLKVNDLSPVKKNPKQKSKTNLEEVEAMKSYRQECNH